MASRYAVENIQQALSERLFPSVTVWNRLEGRPRTSDFDRALRAEVRDALWMLTRQWQMGEFRGDDAGSPIAARMAIRRTQLTKYKPGAHGAEPTDLELPLEARVERRPFPLPLNIRALMGRQWLKMAASAGPYAGEYLRQYPFFAPDPALESDAPVTAHPEVWQAFAAAAGRLMDGGALYLYLTEAAGRSASDNVAIAGGDVASIDRLGAAFVRWFQSLFLQPAGVDHDAWQPARLEYQFACSAPEPGGRTVLTADEYYHGNLDWHHFDYDTSGNDLGTPPAEPPLEDVVKSELREFLPVPISFSGMPNTRWWAFEDGRTNFGDVKPETTELGKLLLVEFGLVYANDWFLIPCEMPIGSLARIQGLSVTNVFGERVWIDAAGNGPDDAWQRWSMFTINTKGRVNEAADTGLLLLPTTSRVLEGKVEEVALIRDEMANMVWGVEKTILAPSGQPKAGFEAGGELRTWYERQVSGPAPGAPDPAAPIQYKLMTTVPENWIPFVPARVAGDSRRIQLQRAAMPRIIAGDPIVRKVRPRTALLQEGRAQNRPYYLHEEEVPRAGVLASQSFQRTRWLDGRTLTWLSVRKTTGRGEGSSGLAFDRIVPTSLPSAKL